MFPLQICPLRFLAVRRVTWRILRLACTRVCSARAHGPSHGPSHVPKDSMHSLRVHAPLSAANPVACGPTHTIMHRGNTRGGWISLPGSRSRKREPLFCVHRSSITREESPWLTSLSAHESRQGSARTCRLDPLSLQHQQGAGALAFVRVMETYACAFVDVVHRRDARVCKLHVDGPFAEGVMARQPLFSQRLYLAFRRLRPFSRSAPAQCTARRRRLGCEAGCEGRVRRKMLWRIHTPGRAIRRSGTRSSQPVVCSRTPRERRQHASRHGQEVAVRRRVRRRARRRRIRARGRDLVFNRCKAGFEGSVRRRSWSATWPAALRVSAAPMRQARAAQHPRGGCRLGARRAGGRRDLTVDLALLDGIQRVHGGGAPRRRPPPPAARRPPPAARRPPPAAGSTHAAGTPCVGHPTSQLPKLAVATATAGGGRALGASEARGRA